MLLDRRRSGVLLHPTSLPGKYGIGDLGPAAYDFVDYLARAKQTVWQVLPLGPTGYGDSPYASPSAFAGNPLLIAPEPLVELGLLEAQELRELEQLPHAAVEFARLRLFKDELLNTAFRRAREQSRTHAEHLSIRIQAFRTAQAAWLEDYALFAALTETHGLWTSWPEPLRRREHDALASARAQLEERIDFHVFCQYLFFDQWSALRARANAVGIAIMGDIPIFVAHDSADVWANPHLFKLDADGHPTVVAGVPPDYFSTTGQLWGNPLYDWLAMQEADYTWWVARFRHLLELVDLVRVDHFRGFEAAWEVPATAETAIHGAWIKGPGKDVFEAVNRALGERVPIIAEDLGLITDAVRDLLSHTRFPGMKVLQFAFGGGTDNLYLPHNYPSPNCVVYTGTHDNDTTRGWFAQASKHERSFVTKYVGAHASDDVTYALIRLALSSIANTAIVPLQDVLNLDTEARMNTPGATGSSWMWRIRADQLDPACADRLADLTTLYGRA
jgi:4-alpha-glucanotransferase